MAERQLSLADSTSAVALDLRWLSAGSVARVSGSGPALASRRRPRRRQRASTFTPAVGRPDRVLIAVMSVAWLAGLAAFWLWWLEPAHRVGPFGLAVNSAVLGYVTGFPVFFIASANRLRKVNPRLAVPPLRVAFVVTRAPSEPWTVARTTLTAMLAQDFSLPYDVWLCDEQPTSEIAGWCAGHGVRISTRAGVRSYHRKSWPRRTRCKEGNLAYFYDRWGYRSYDVVSQLDCDHVPERGYLTEMVRPFSDPAVGYVAAPSVCDANGAASWSARGRLHREATFHGPFQLGHSVGFGPLCIGSHYAVRTSALREIGGIGPDLAEDFSTTFLMNAAGWQGAFAIDAEAHGDGPNTFAAMTVQEFQWSRSLTTLMLSLVPRNLRRLSWRLRFRFLYALAYYSLLVTTMLAGLSLAPIAAVTGLPWIHVNYLAFITHLWLITIWLVLIALLLRRRGLLRPKRAPIVSWEGLLYNLTRWPYVALGIGAALGQRLRPRQVTFKVTAKVRGDLERLSIRLMIPFVAISCLSSAAAIVGEHRLSPAPGYIVLSAVTGTMYALVSLAVPVRHALEAARTAGVSFGHGLRRTAAPPLLLGTCAAGAAGAAIALYSGYATRMLGW